MSIATSEQPIVIHKNRKRAFWSLIIILCMVPVSVAILYLGLQPGRPDVGWIMVSFGVLGVAIFSASAVLIIRTIRAPWRLELSPQHLVLYAPPYDLVVRWADILGIAVDKVDSRPGCVLVFDDVASVVQGATFHQSKARNAVDNAEAMRRQMEENFRISGYHLVIPGRLLEMGPDELAELLAAARMGEQWREEG
jgi:hypothetical protein